MAAQLITDKRLLTHYCNKLDTIISRFKQEELETLNVAAAQGESASQYLRESLQRLNEAIGALDAVMINIKQTLTDYAARFTDLDYPTEKEKQDFEEYSTTAEKALISGTDYSLVLKARVHAFREVKLEPGYNQQSGSVAEQMPPQLPASSFQQLPYERLDLPTLPIPTFQGNIWEWDNFWELFNENVHSRNIPELCKFNYLLQALRGDALALIKKFQVAKGNYSKAIEFLQHKYGNREELVTHLIEKLGKCHLHSTSTRDQRILFEQLQVIIMQLRQKEVQVDNQWMYQQVLTKFPDTVQRKVLVRKQAAVNSGAPFNLDSLIQYLEEEISTDEMLAVYMKNTKPDATPGKSEKRRERTKTYLGACMYCEGSHKSADCKRYSTPQERSNYLREKKLCLICASAQHSTSNCRKRMCFRCGGPHHTSCCFKGDTTVAKEASTKTSPPLNEKTKPKARDTGRPPLNKTTKVNVLYEDNPKTEAVSALELQPVHSNRNSSRTFLPAGVLTVMNPSTKSLKKVGVLLDSGAEVSFIESSLAEELELSTIETKTLPIHTFGTEEVKENVCRRVLLQGWDSDGHTLELNLFTHDILTAPLDCAPCEKEDLEYMKEQNILMADWQNITRIQPRILLGCDQLWPLIKENQPRVCLPSGLYLLSTRLGNLITGTVTKPQKHLFQQNETAKWEAACTMDGSISILTLQTPITQSDEEEDSFEKYLVMESAGTEEFMSSEKTAQEKIDQQVWNQFKETIEKREDGYYVRLPWKSIPFELPDNKAIALRRLESVWNTLQKDEKLLEQYNEVFEEQLKTNILEEVPDDSVSLGEHIHYVPHQAVITPHKTTTKLRIVFDASAHYKAAPSLNDVLHRGPVILPQLYGILLRFRIGKIAMISDVEKAFLQVRLHEADRDATRCLWLRNYRSPPASENIKTLRFTRVTFGLITSPFLLAATTHFHLDQYPQDRLLTDEIKENMYVDNLMMTVDTEEEADHIYRRTKGIFNDLKMNLREYVTNNADVTSKFDMKDASSETKPKVLGIRWNSREDTIEVSCAMHDHMEISKRKVASMIASVYDPMGWMLPLMHKAKRFLRELWQMDCDWDTPLSPNLHKKWKKICEGMHGFTRTLPRFICTKMMDAILITFADASEEAIATCSYLRSGSNSPNLVMAKGKLPSLKGKSTIPKRELDAVTLALRMTNSILAQLRSVLQINQVFVFSDSEIVLSWIRKNPLKDVGPVIFRRLLEINKILHHLNDQGYTIHFNYVTSEENPADAGTRGLSLEELQDHPWWTGPKFLKNPPQQWSQGEWHIRMESTFTEREEVPTEGKQVLASRTVEQCQNEEDSAVLSILQRHTWQQTRRIVAWILRFVRNAVKQANTINGTYMMLSTLLSIPIRAVGSRLNGKEIFIAGKLLIRLHQRQITPKAMNSMQQLNIKKDDEGLLRCYGRLGNSDLDDEAKVPLIILQNSMLAERIIDDCHSRGHPSVSHTMANIRRQYWIPKLRAQVTRFVRRCVPCQKFNNLPYKYPEQTDLPARRVQKSRPFEHVGLDYYGPLPIALPDGTEGKCYGSIMTCMTTRLIHLDIVSDMSTTAFLWMLRRFFARRGVPRSITSDNAPTFMLGETILREAIRAAENDPAIEREVLDKEIEWHYNTPYVPWQGGFYERLIKSVKQTLYKTLGKGVLSFEELTTVIIEIEAILNTRPLLYVESDFANERILRPIDFLQNEMRISYPLEAVSEEEEDPSYLPPAEKALLRTKAQTVQALQSSCKLTEKFWQLWRNHYLTALREKHKRQVGNQRSSSYTPKVGEVVLLCEPVQPRHAWKVGRIEELVRNSEGIIREALVKLPSQRRIRRPLNLLIPLELEERDQQVQEPNTASSDDRNEQLEEAQTPRYNLRPNRRVDYRGTSAMPIMKHVQTSTLLLICLLSALCGDVNALAKLQARKTHSIKCVAGGVELLSKETVPYEVCAEDYCRSIPAPKTNESIHFPPQITLHEQFVQWKLLYNETIRIIETVCPPTPFCDQIDCILCSAVIFNPECWPVGAIIATTIVIYFFITGCYVFCYVPLTLGKPCRIALRLLWRGIKGVVRRGFRPLQRARRRQQIRASELIELLAIVAVMSITAGTAEGCQQVNLFSHKSTVCIRANGTEMCKIHVSEVLKINPFKREACFRLTRNNSTIHEVRASWKLLSLTCEQEHEMYTRDTIYNVVDSKRCPHTGSCVGSKCASINATSLLPELEKGNRYPGITACVESCGGPGCDCFYWSSGCLFYRIYLTPVSPQVYEIFHCNRWTLAAKVRFTDFDAIQGVTRMFTAVMLPNVPIMWNTFSLTLTSVTMPPTPLLNTAFITDGNNTALWNSVMKPPLWCTNKSAAEQMDCTVIDNCQCAPAEVQANCKCRDVRISEMFGDVRNRLPAIFPAVSFKQNDEGQVKAEVQSLTTAEIIVTIQENVRTNVVVDSTVCTIEDAILTGCYKCARGAKATVKCTAPKQTQAEIICESASFTVDCDQQGVLSELQFSLDRARVQMTCSVSCGTVVTTFEIGGILRFTQTAHGMMTQWLSGNGDQAAETQWPDFLHIAEVFLQWYKTLIVAVIALLIVLGITYACFSLQGVCCVFRFLKGILLLILLFFRLLCRPFCLLQSEIKGRLHEKRL